MIHVTKDDALARLQAARQKLPKDQDRNSEIFRSWRERTLSDLRAIFGNDSERVKRFEQVSFSPNISVRMSIRQQGRTAVYDEQARLDDEAFKNGCEQAERKLVEFVSLVNEEPDVQVTPQPKEVPMYARRQRAEFEMHLREEGKPVFLHKGYDSPLHSKRRIEKSVIKINGGVGSFEFPEQIDIDPGDLLQQDGSTILWQVMGTTGHTEGETFIKFEAEVTRIWSNAAPPPAGPGSVYIEKNYGAVQLHSPHATQNVNVTINQQVVETVNQIKQAIADSDELDGYDKDDIRHELDRLCKIAKREPSEKTKTSINEKLTTVEKMLSVATKLKPIVLPAILALRQYLAGH